MQPKTISLSVEPEVNEVFRCHFGAVETGVPLWVRAFPALYASTLKELKGRFQRGELYLLIDLWSEKGEGPPGDPASLVEDCRTRMEEHGLDRKWVIDAGTLLDKLGALTVFQAFCLELWGRAFYQAGGSASSAKIDRDLENHVCRLI